MTTNARDEKWSEWIFNKAGLCPVNPGTFIEYKMRKHGNAFSSVPGQLRWSITNNDWSDIIAYRYKIKEPESDMHPDLEWLARNVSEWPLGGQGYIQKTLGGSTCSSNRSMISSCSEMFTKAQWLQARKDLGLIMSDEEEEMGAGEWSGSVPEGVVTHDKYSAYFKDVRHIDTLDVYRVVSLFDCEKHGHPISHAAKKLLLSGSRTGGKDVESDVREAIDTLYRWLEMREEDKARE